MEETAAVKMAPARKPFIRFLYNYCNDLQAVRKLYSECLGLPEASYMDTPQFGWLSYKLGDLDYMFFREDTEKLPLPHEFAAQPGGGGGTRPVPSWSLQVPEEEFAGLVQKVKQSGFRTNQPYPVWLQDSYWGLVVMDPAGNTVELFTCPKQRPAATEWKT